MVAEEQLKLGGSRQRKTSIAQFLRGARWAALILVAIPFGCLSNSHDEEESIAKFIRQWRVPGITSWTFVGNIMADGAIYRRLHVIELIELGNRTDPSSGFATISAERGGLQVELVDRQNSPSWALSVHIRNDGYALSLTNSKGIDAFRLVRENDGSVRLSGNDLMGALSRAIAKDTP